MASKSPKDSGIWKYVKSDRVPLAHAEATLRFYEQDLIDSQNYLRQVEGYRRVYGKVIVPDNLLARAKKDVEISKKNLDFAKRQLEKTKDRLGLS